jgi:hypothetical protein
VDLGFPNHRKIFMEFQGFSYPVKNCRKVASSKIPFSAIVILDFSKKYGVFFLWYFSSTGFKISRQKSTLQFLEISSNFSL